MINRFLITGDTHREFSRFKNYDKEIQNDEHTAIIILGDSGINWTLDEHDAQLKNFLTKRYKFRIYCVRGNHEARPQDVKGMKLIYDEDVNGEVYIQEQWPQIRYFKDWGIYNINNHPTAIIGGAYSVDKQYRLERGGIWFPNEQLSDEEMLAATIELTNQDVDFVFTHTCPVCWEPTDLFLNGIDQNKVDRSMELFLEEIFKCFGWKIACFGHYHANRLERPYVEQYSTKTENLETIWQRWQEYDAENHGLFDWWLPKSPMFYADDEILQIRKEYWKDENR